MDDATDGGARDEGGLVEVGERRGGGIDEAGVLLALEVRPEAVADVVERKLGGWKNGLVAPGPSRAFARGGLAKLLAVERR